MYMRVWFLSRELGEFTAVKVLYSRCKFCNWTSMTVSKYCIGNFTTTFGTTYYVMYAFVLYIQIQIHIISLRHPHERERVPFVADCISISMSLSSGSNGSSSFDQNRRGNRKQTIICGKISFVGSVGRSFVHSFVRSYIYSFFVAATSFSRRSAIATTSHMHASNAATVYPFRHSLMTMTIEKYRSWKLKKNRYFLTSKHTQYTQNTL